MNNEEVIKPLNIKAVYLAIELPEESRIKLLRRVEPSFDVVLAHHVTIQHDLRKMSDDEMKRWVTTEHDITAIGFAENDRVQAVVVSVGNAVKRPDGKLFHVTISHDRGAAPRESNELLLDESNIVDFNTPFSIAQGLKALWLNK